VSIAKVEMLIRKPAMEVYEAFINPAIISRFWFTRGCGRLVSGKQVQWDWEMYGASAIVEVKVLDPRKRILIEWGEDEMRTTVEWAFSEREKGNTFGSITNAGFGADGDKVVAMAMDSEAGFELVLAGLKAYLEYGIELNLIADRFPDNLADVTSQNPSID
jgi:uncharacterized protein YndB with AHSA1/START domain